ncbi:hypothetical protein EXO38_11415, partial [Salmonella enterica]|nr:hypothetical protein [Salmonella enterica]EDX7694624.1 hypothetical protein [Salmonella enterica subsp. enterica serovar Cerro]EEI9844128.1 hypothetical protein [Salmonella enterica subsp. enterica serovar Cerro]
MNKILFVCARFPWPLLTGDALRAYNQIKVLSEKNVVDVFSVEKPFASQCDINKYLNVSSSGKITKLRKIYNILSHSKDTALQCAMYYDQQ